MDAAVLYLNALWALLVETGWWLLAGFAAAGLVHAFVPAEALKRWIGGAGAASSARAALSGVLLPLCSCSVIPVAAQLRRAGASRGATASFAISTPQTGEESIPLTWALLGPVFAITRPVAAIATAVLAGTLIDALPGRRTIPGEPNTPANDAACGGGGACGCSPTVSLSVNTEDSRSSCCAPEDPAGPERPSLPARLRGAARYGFVRMPIDLAPWLAVGFALSALVAAAVPPGWIAEHVGSGPIPMLTMLVVGLPLYICATNSTPLAYTLVVAGLSPGAALVLLLAGPATNLATVAWAVRDLGVRATAVYLGSVAAVAVAAGLALDAALPTITEVAADAAHHEHGGSIAAAFGGAALAILLAACLARRAVDLLPSSSPGASCCGGSTVERPDRNRTAEEGFVT